MKVLVISEEYPMFDKNSGSVRFLRFLEAITTVGETYFFNCSLDKQVQRVGEKETARYRDQLANRGIRICEGDLVDALHKEQYDYIFFEFYGPALRHLDVARLHQPHAKMVVDTVDVHFKRIFAKYELGHNPRDLKEARRVRRKELKAYDKADIVITVTADDKEILLAENRSLKIEIIPNIHECPALGEKNCPMNSLLFIGGFRHNPNTDAVLYMIHEILPFIRQEIPDVKFTIVGDSPPEEVRNLASEQIIVTGYVEDTLPYLEQHAISVAPLRYGAGMKGKVGEAMAFGTPVVTTSVGAEGFGMMPGRDALVADDPQQFAACVVQLLRDPDPYAQVRLNGWRFINDNYSKEVVDQSIVSFLERNRKCPVKALKITSRWALQVRSLLAL